MTRGERGQGKDAEQAEDCAAQRGSAEIREVWTLHDTFPFLLDQGTTQAVPDDANNSGSSYGASTDTDALVQKNGSSGFCVDTLRGFIALKRVVQTICGDCALHGCEMPSSQSGVAMQSGARWRDSRKMRTDSIREVV
jgi:hypothetical protein